jgi:hypothetical protein
MSTTPNLTITELEPSQAQPHIVLNGSMRRLDAIVQCSCVDQLDTPPVSPTEGSRYLVGDLPNGEFAGHAQEVAAYIGGGWSFFDPQDGWIAYLQSASAPYIYESGAWQPLATGGTGSPGDSPTPGGAGSWVLISTATASSSSELDFAVDAGEYEQYKIELVDIILGTSAANLDLRFGTGIGPTWDSGSNYDYQSHYSFGTTGAGTHATAATAAAAFIRLTIGGANSSHDVPIVATALAHNLQAGVNARISQGRLDFDGAGGLASVFFGGVYNVTTEVTGIRLFPSSGTITSGRALLFGRNFS